MKTNPPTLLILLSGLPFLPISSHAQGQQTSLISVEMSMTAYLILGFLLVLSTIMFFLFQHRFKLTATELKDLSNELGTTRHKLEDSNQSLTQSKQDLKTTTNRYQSILFEAKVGMFQMDLSGQCTYINSALQEMSGLYPKKVLKNGLSSAIHPDDRDTFNTAWSAFTDDGSEFNHTFRFQHMTAGDIHVECQANKLINEKKEVESYIGWISNITDFHNEKRTQQAESARLEYFISETIEGFYKLEPKSPIPLASDPLEMAKTISSQLVLTDCNTTFAAMYGAKPAELLGKSITELKDGCGPFLNNDALKTFIEADYKSTNLESIRQDPKGNRINLLNNAIGLVENSTLVVIFGSQRNISQQKREEAELSNQVTFMHRILNALPGDVHVKDTRCRYLYTGKTIADRTGIPPEEWIGKTIFEVMPATPKDHDYPAIKSMKTGKPNRTEYPYEVRGKLGWQETIQIPLISKEELVEGVVSLSIDISDRKKKEMEVQHLHNQLEKQLKHTQTDLSTSQSEHSKTTTSLSEAIQKLTIVETEKINQEHQLTEQLTTRKRAEDTLRNNEQNLITRQQQLEEHLSNRLSELATETDKRKKWAELLAIKENDLRILEKHEAQLNKHYEQETDLRKQTESSLKVTQTTVEKYRTELDTEHRERSKTEKLLTKTKALLQSTQEQIKQMQEQHATELEKEVKTRKAATEKQIQTTENLNELHQQFAQRIDAETKSIKQELAKKQIREKALRQNERELEERIKKLKQKLQLKTEESNELTQAREDAESQKQKIERKLENMSKQQQELIDHETEKLSLDVAEIRLDEIKLHKRIHDLEKEKEILQTQNNDHPPL